MTAAARPDGGVAVAAQGWHWRHAGRSNWALNDLDLSIAPGERVLLLGASGSGKSTLLQGFAGLLDTHEDGDEKGRLLVDGVSPAARRDRIGMVLQNPDSQVILSRVGDDVAFGMENFNVAREAIWPRVRRALTAVGLDLPLLRDTAELSGGQQQRLALAGVLAMNPGLILLDEPTANLDPAGVLEVRNAVRVAAEQTGATLIVIEHRTAVWLPVVDRVIVLGGGGQVVADGAAEDTIAEQRDQLSRAGVWVPGAEPPEITPHRAPGAPLLGATDLSIGYPMGGQSDELSFEIQQATTTIVTGPNGAGKSALALTLGGLLPPRGGRLEAHNGFAPTEHRREPIGWRSRELLTRIGSVFQNPEHQFLTGNVRDELALGPRTLKQDSAAVAKICDELLDRLHLTHLADVNPYTLSGGEKRRLSVATVLATQPELIILDEPTFGQDRNTWEELVRLLAEIADHGTAVVAITHDLDFARLLADRHIELRALESRYRHGTQMLNTDVDDAPARPASINPVAKLAAALVIAVGLVLSIDWVSALTALALELVLVAVLRVPLRALLSRGAVLLLTAGLTAVTILLYGQPSGVVHWHFLLITVSDGSITLALATFLRVLAIALPSVFLFIDTDPTELADGLGQVLRLPARFVLGALAGFRLVGLLGQDWRYLGYARRARGVADQARIRRAAGQAFALLVSAVRRGSMLATAMEARGFGAHPSRTWARPSPFGWREIALIVASFVIVAAAITTSVSTGHWYLMGAR